MAKKASGTIYPLAALRALVLHTQLLSAPNDAPSASTPDTIVNLVKALGYVQIDTLHVVNRAHHLTLWARFGSYDIEDFHQLIYTPGQRHLYEGWGHAASIIPLEHYRNTISTSNSPLRPSAHSARSRMRDNSFASASCAAA